MSNSAWHDFETDPPPVGSTVLAYCDKARFGSHYGLLQHTAISNGSMYTMDGMFSWDWGRKVLCWRFIADLAEDIPLKFIGGLDGSID